MKSNVTVPWMLTAAALVCTAFVPDAKACHASLIGSSLAARGLTLGSAANLAMSPTGTSQSPQGAPTLVGMWIVDFIVADTGQLYDRAMEQIYADGNEMMHSSAFPPVLDNSCYGTWRATGPGSLRLRHIGWNYDSNAVYAGTARLLATMTLDPGGDSYTGTFEADAIDLTGKHIPGTTVTGILKASRFKPI